MKPCLDAQQQLSNASPTSSGRPPPCSPCSQGVIIDPQDILASDAHRSQAPFNEFWEAASLLAMPPGEPQCASGTSNERIERIPMAGGRGSQSAARVPRRRAQGTRQGTCGAAAEIIDCQPGTLKNVCIRQCRGSGRLICCWRSRRAACRATRRRRAYEGFCTVLQAVTKPSLFLCQCRGSGRATCCWRSRHAACLATSCAFSSHSLSTSLVIFSRSAAGACGQPAAGVQGARRFRQPGGGASGGGRLPRRREGAAGPAAEHGVRAPGLRAAPGLHHRMPG